MVCYKELESGARTETSEQKASKVGDGWGQMELCGRAERSPRIRAWVFPGMHQQPKAGQALQQIRDQTWSCDNCGRGAGTRYQAGPWKESEATQKGSTEELNEVSL